MLALLAQAKPTITIDPVNDGNVKITDIGLLFTSVLNLALLISAVLVFAYLVIGGIEWIMSGGDKSKTESARNKITASLVGLAIVASSYALMQVVAYFFGIDVFHLGDQIKRPF
ncbi:MAG: hypothetical protein UX04_C0002G0033 [Microgenomates group bacterium GW2011_GWF2_45_18]|nr:MAG: hypothetical protein UW18_C0001G0064 [Microgenomates group bacterium GW2011_GWF1_44_10]KKU01890.1 MAG: hypothetical protein UX04_C0002G0033 [Microgenomates group bacterium GW2011_GWF2_45_18]OGJ40259.1 MAG: hypothetical protein A2378_03510 [Candidatus Pacebacteria bacterium RIFOXYB1_FULL_44_10]HAU98793.1 hypothetical protein [Candidatus Paceibacterota bacterium]HAX01387.1 hypothetical protein [Candidatus Paceibacterota bacterium]